jgi:hypothetical protein
MEMNHGSKGGAMRYLVILLLLAAACAQLPLHNDSDPMNVSVASWKPLDVAPLNQAIEEAVAGGELETSTPLLIVFDLVGGDREALIFALEQEYNRAEQPDSVRVTVVRDGLLDDSVRGDWHEFRLYRMADGTWRVAQARRAVRCRRPDTGDYRSGPCQ